MTATTVAATASYGPGATLPAGGTAYRLRVDAWGEPGPEGSLRRVELVRNGEPFACWEPASAEKRFSAEVEYVASGNSWVVARAVTARGGVAVASPLYFRPAGWQPPRPIEARVTLVVEDASGAALSSPVSVEAIADGCLLWTRRLAGRQSRCRVPAIAWFRVHAPGYRAATRSIFYDFEPLRAACTHLGLTPAQKAVALATPEPFERIRSLLNDVQLQVVLRS